MTRLAMTMPAVALLLCACGSEKQPEPDDTEVVGPQGEVQGGTISDAMLPIGEVKSRSPQRGGGDNAKKGDAE